MPRRFALLRSKRSRSDAEEEDDDDPLGEALQTIFNAHVGFRYDPNRNNKEYGSETTWSTPPLLTRHNGNALKGRIMACYTRQRDDYYYLNCKRASLANCGFVALQVLLCGILILVVASLYVTIYVTGTAWWLLLFFVDPSQIVPLSIRQQVWQLWHYMDQHVLYGHWYQHRTSTSAAAAASFTIKEANDSSVVSEATAKHLQAIQFCQEMVKEHVKLQSMTNTFGSARKSCKQSNKRNVSEVATTILDDKTTIDNNNNNNGDASSMHESNSTTSSDNHFSSEHSLHLALSRTSSNMSEGATADLPWMDVGAKIGMRLFHSAHVQRVIAATPERSNNNIDGDVDDPVQAMSAVATAAVEQPSLSSSQKKRPEGGTPRLPNKPVHTLWTSPTAAANISPALSTRSEDDEVFFGRGNKSPSNTNNINNSNYNNNPGRTMRGKPPLSPPTPSSQLQQQQRNPSTTTEMEEAAVMAVERVLGNKRDGEERNLSPPQLLSTSSSGVSRHTTLSSSSLLTAMEHNNQKHCKFIVVQPQPIRQRQPLRTGVKVAVPIFPQQPRQVNVQKRYTQSQYQMGTVIHSERIFVRPNNESSSPQQQQQQQCSSVETNCLSVTVNLDKAFLRNAEFAELTFRVMDNWPMRYMPKCSKVPIGSCVATKFGIGVLVGWRVEGDIHVVRSLWTRRGDGSAHAYLNRDAIYSMIEAAVGFDVQTRFGSGVVVAYVDGGRRFESGRFVVTIKDEGRHCGHALEIHRRDIYSCHGSQFLPIIEHVREAARYRIQLDNYNAAVREQLYSDAAETSDPQFWSAMHECADILWGSFLTAVEQDTDFDAGVNEFMASVIEFLERLDQPAADRNETADDATVATMDTFLVSDFEVECVPEGSIDLVESKEHEVGEQSQEPGFWLINDFFGGLFKQANQSSVPVAAGDTMNMKHQEQNEADGKTMVDDRQGRKPTNFERAFAVIRTLMRTITIAKAASVDHPHLRLALTVVHEGLLFLRNVLKVVYKNRSTRSTEIWKQALEDFTATFGPLKARLAKIGRGIAQRMEKQGRKAKIRVLQFVDTIVGDEKLLFAMEQGDWYSCLGRIEIALVKSKVIDENSLLYYQKTGQYIYNHLQSCLAANDGAATRNTEKMAFMAHCVQSLAAPRRSALKFLLENDVLELLERILVRVYCREELASRMMTIHASNFQTLRHLRILKDVSVAGRMWRPLLDAADEEFSWVVSHMPENSKDLMCPLSSLFSLCVARFHKMSEGDLSRDWLDFLLEQDAVRIIQEIDMKLLVALKTFSADIKEMMVVLPYYSSIDEDILKLMDEVDVNEFLKEVAAAIEDPEKLSNFLREKATTTVERFLNYLPRMSIPVEKREIGEGFVLTCRGHDGNDLTLSDVVIKRENLVCQILGGDSLFFPMFGEDPPISLPVDPDSSSSTNQDDEGDILDHIRVLLLQAQSYGCWKPGVGGVGQSPSDLYAASVLKGLPVSSVLNCAIELRRNLEIDDDELLEVAIRDISFQIQLEQKREDGAQVPETLPEEHRSMPLEPMNRLRTSSSFDSPRRRFNPRLDPTVLFLEINNLTLHLDNFMFRIEKSQQQSVFDPVFEGRGMVSLQNISIRLRVDCAKQRLKKPGHGTGVMGPVLQIRELTVRLENMKVKIKDTGFGSDWLLNRVVKAFAKNITQVVEDNLRDQIKEQCTNAIDSLNAYFVVNPGMLLSILGVSIDDLVDDTLVFV